MRQHHGMHMMDNFFGGFGFFSILWMIVWVGIIIGAIFLIVYLVKKTNPKNTNNDKSAIRILEERFARGEIDELEYREKRRVLEDE